MAGNVPGGWSIGGNEIAVDKLATIRLLGVIGHTSCQAMGVAVDAFLAPPSYLGVAAQLPLRAIVESLFPAGVCAAAAPTDVYGPEVATRPRDRAALVELSVLVNAALTASALRQTFVGRLGEALDVVYGVCNVKNRAVGLPTGAAPSAWEPAPVHPPQRESDVVGLGRDLAAT